MFFLFTKAPTRLKAKKMAPMKRGKKGLPTKSNMSNIFTMAQASVEDQIVLIKEVDQLDRDELPDYDPK